MKECTKCKQTLPSSEFHKNSRKKDGLQSWCKLCKNAHHAKYYVSKKETWRLADKQRRLRSMAKLTEIKEKQHCMDCGGKFPACAMDFDHVSGIKLDNVSTMAQNGFSWEMITAEMKKCELVCANCHRIRTRDRARGEAQLQAEVFSYMRESARSTSL